MENNENYYDILGVSEKATNDEIKKSYRKMQMKYHPDKNNNSIESNDMTRKINEAYEILGNEKKREEYDFMKKNPFMKMNPHMSHGNMEVPIDDIFNMFFGGGMPFGMQGMQGMPPGANVHIFHGGPMGFQQALQKPPPIIKELTIKIEQVLSGANIPLEIERWILESNNKVFENETIYVTIPQGIDDGEIIILRNKGNVINEKNKGDIKIFIKIVNDTAFKRVGLDLILEKTINLKESLCGFSFEIKYINGKSYTLNNNKGNIIPPGYKKIYPDMGLTRNEHKGNMIIIFNINFPETLSNEKIETLENIL